MKSETLNMTSGNPTTLLLTFSIPMLIGNIFQQIYDLADSMIVGRFVGADALAAVGATASVSFLFFALCNGIGNGGGIITAQNFGTGNQAMVKKAIVNSAYAMAITSLLVCLFSYAISGLVLSFLGTPAEITKDALTYMRLQCLSVPFIAIYNYASAMLRALGDAKTPLYFLIFSCFLNIGMDLLFVCSFQMGVFGAALATLIAQLIAGTTCLLYAIWTNEYFRPGKQDFRPEPTLLLNVIQLGMPLSLQFALIAISSMAMQSVVNSFGAVAIAAFTATSRMEQLVHQPYGSLSAALATYTGQNFGAGKLDRVKLGLKKSILIMCLFSLVMFLLMQLFGNSLIRLFVTDESVIALGTKALQITSLFYLSLGMINVIRGILNGIGDATFAFSNGIVELIGRMTVPYALTRILGIFGIWWSAGLVWLISAFFCVVRYYSWRKKIFSA